MSARTPRARFEAARRRYLDVRRDRERFQLDVLVVKYGRMEPQLSWLTRGEVARLDVLRRRENRVSDAMFALLDEYGGRNWRSLVPYTWVMSELSWEDATTTGQLSVVPPPGYGSTVVDMKRFAAPVEVRA